MKKLLPLVLAAALAAAGLALLRRKLRRMGPALAIGPQTWYNLLQSLRL